LSEKRIETPLTLGVQLARIAKEAGLVLVIGCNLFLLLAVLSYHPKDPGWSHLGYQSEVFNLAGVTGAWIADFAVSLLGVGAYLLPFLLIWPALRFLRRRSAGLLDAIPFVMVRTTGAAILLLALSTLAAMHLSNEQLEYPFTAGGLVGQALSDLSVAWLGLVGGSVLHWTLLLFGMTLYVDVSWRAALEASGGVLLAAVARIGAAGATARRQAERPPTPTDTAKKGGAIESPASRFAPSAPKARRVEPPISLSSAAIEPSPAHSVEAAPAQARVDETVAPLNEPPLLTALESAEAIVEMPAEMPAEVTEVAPWSVREPGEPAPAAGEGRKSVRIVPLSEAHKPLPVEENGQPEPVAPRKLVRKLPSLELLDPPELQTDQGYSEEELEQMSRLLEEKLKDFGVIAEVVEVNPGPVITRFELQPAPGVKASKISNLARDLARSMAVSSVRVVEVIPGKSVVGIEIPNASRQTVRLSEVLNAKPYLEASSKLTLALGNDIAGNPVVANLAKMPHLLVAGTTGSGKSVGVNAMLLSLLFKATPDEVRLMLVDPKMLELSIYDGIPHLLTPVITDMKEAAGGLRWCVAEMERRYRLMAKMGVRNIAGFNDKLVQAEERGEPLRDPLWNPAEQGFDADEPAPLLEPLPYIVVVIDEFADMMMMVGKKVEELIARIAQKARAAGIHLILATQRPSVDVITGLIKANIPTRIAFQVSSKIDSRTILDQSGAENLLGYGDMLYLPAGTSVPNRVHGAFVSDDEVHRTVEAWKEMGSPIYIDEILSDIGGDSGGSGGSGNLFDDESDPLYDEAVAFVTESRKASISSVQRKLKIGYNRAARMIETMEAAGVITEAGSNGQREVLAPPPPRD